MAFKGTERVGTRDSAREAPLLDAMDEVSGAWEVALRECGGWGRALATVMTARPACLHAQSVTFWVGWIPNVAFP